MNKAEYFLIYKPYGMLSQFSDDGSGKPTLKDLDYKFRKNIYPVGRLDHDSEGLLLLTNDKNLNTALLNPASQKSKTYYCFLEGAISEEALQKLESGVTISTKKGPHHTLPAQAERIGEPSIPMREIRQYPSKEYSWVCLTIHEGKNRQVRKMTAAVGFPTLRLVRYSICDISIGNLQPGQVIKISANSAYKKLNLLLPPKA